MCRAGLLVLGFTGLLGAIAGGSGVVGSRAHADDAAPAAESPAARGYRWLTTRAYLPAAFDRDQFDHLFEVWPDRLRDEELAIAGHVRKILAQ